MELPGGKDAKPNVVAKWGSLNTQVSRAAISQEEFAWLENLFPIKPGNLRSTYAEGSNAYTASGLTIIYFYPFNLGSTAYVAVFLSDGSAVQVKVSDNSTVTIGAAGTFYSGGAIPTCSQYQSLYLLIGSDVSSNAYWAWDGAHLFGAGTLSPQVTVVSGGSNYTSTPTLTAAGGSGTGSTFSVTVANGQVTNAVCTNGGSGYQLGDQVTLSFSGGGSDTEAQTVTYACPYASAVGAVQITAAGTGYTSAPTVTISGPATTASTFGTVQANVSGGKVVSLTVTKAGQCIYSPTYLTLNGGSGTGAIAIVYPDSSSTLTGMTYTIVSGGSGYVTSFTANVNAETPVTATATATVTNGGVTAITIINPGYGYLPSDTVTISFSGGGGSGATAVPTTVKGLVGRAYVTQSGSGYVSNPTITISSPDDPSALLPTTATAVSAINTSGQVTSVTIVTHGAGYLKPNIDLRGGNDAAHAEAVLMPFGIQATAIETYNNQVWTTANPTAGPKMSFTAPNSISDFSTFSGGGSSPATDAFLRASLIALKQGDGYLYRVADSSTNVITNVQTASTGITTFNNSNVDAEIGTIWRDTICSFQRAIVFANSTGVFAMFGGAINKVSDELDGLFETASFNTGQSGVTPTAAVVTMFGKRVYCLLFTTTDPYSNTLRPIMACWDGKNWFITTQTKTLTRIGYQELNSVFTGWGTDGTHLFKLFQTASTSLTKVFQTRLDGADTPHMVRDSMRGYLVCNVVSGGSTTVNVGLDVVNSTGLHLASALSTTQAVTVPSGISYTPFVPNLSGGDVMGTMLGWTVTTTSQDIQFTLLQRLERDDFSITA